MYDTLAIFCALGEDAQDVEDSHSLRGQAAKEVHGKAASSYISSPTAASTARSRVATPTTSTTASTAPSPLDTTLTLATPTVAVLVHVASRSMLSHHLQLWDGGIEAIVWMVRDGVGSHHCDVPGLQG